MVAVVVCFLYLLEGVGIRGVWSRPGGNEGIYVFNQMPRRVLCVGEGGVGRGEPAKAKTCCKQSIEEGALEAKQVHGSVWQEWKLRNAASPIAHTAIRTRRWGS
jgi:hypothetical protein